MNGFRGTGVFEFSIIYNQEQTYHTYVAMYTYVALLNCVYLSIVAILHSNTVVTL